MLKSLNKRRRKGQSTVEYAVLIVIVIAALLSIQIYIKRGVSGRMRDSADQIGDQFELGNTRAISSTNSWSRVNENYTRGQTSTNLLEDETTNAYSDTTILNVGQRTW